MVTRRGFLAGLGAAAAAGAGGLWTPKARAAPAGSASGAGKRSRVIVIRPPSLSGGTEITSAAVQDALGEAIRALTGASTAADGWAAHFKPADRLGLKVNCLGHETRPQVALGLAEALGCADVPEERVIVWDRFNRELEAAGYDLRAKGKGVRCYGTDALGARGKGGYAADLATSGAIGSLYSRIVTDETTALVSVSVLKDHNLAGLSGALKNFYGAIHNPNKYHENNCDPFIADVCAHANIRGRLRMALCDATRPQYHLGPPTRPRYQWPYGGLIVGTDAVAVDRVGLEILARKRAAMGMKTLGEEGRPARHLASAEARGLGAATLERIEILSLGRSWLDVS